MEKSLRDTTVVVTSLDRTSAVSARGALVESIVGANLEESNEKSNLNANKESYVEMSVNVNAVSRFHSRQGQEGFGDKQRFNHAPRIQAEDTKKCVQTTDEASTTKSKITPTGFAKPPNERLLEMIGTRCLITELLVRVEDENTQPIIENRCNFQTAIRL